MSQALNLNFCSNSQMEYGRMYEQYMHKNSDVFDVSLSIPESGQSPYMSDQNMSNSFSPFESGGGRSNGGSGDPFGQEMNPMNVGSLGAPHEQPPHTSSHPIQPQPHSHPQAMYQMGVVSGHIGGNNPQFPPQHMYIPPISQHGQLMAAHLIRRFNMTTGYGCGGLGGPVPPVYTSAGMMVNGPPPPHPMMGGAPGGLMHGGYYPRPQGVRTAGGSPNNSGGSPSPGSEDSDDAAAASQGGKAKRPSPEVPPDGAQPAKGKKPRVSKKSKKKKDPNEPNKPVSAYALFFRDTQAAIKGSNPNASFGEVSKIVASMWDSLDAENKSVYKKKTEAAKKEYLKALAAYRASLVSKGEGESAVFPGHVAPPGGNYQPYGFPSVTNAPHQQQQQQQSHSPPQISPLGTKKPPTMMNPMMGGPPDPTAMMGRPPMSQPMPPSAPSMMPLGPSPMGQHPNNAHVGVPSAAPHLTTLNNVVHPSTSPYLAQQNNPSLSSPVSNLGSDVGSPGSGGPLPPGPQQVQSPQQGSPPHQVHPIHTHHHHPHMQQPQPPQQQQHIQQQQQQQQQQHIPPQQNPGNLGGAGPQNTPSSNGMPTCQVGGSCIRSGCSNPAVHNPEWEDEYCSNECVVSHCRDVFNSWVQGGQGCNSTYPAPVK